MPHTTRRNVRHNRSRKPHPTILLEPRVHPQEANSFNKEDIMYGVLQRH